MKQQEFQGYVYFEDPEWWRGFKVTEQCARDIEGFRSAIAALKPWDGVWLDAYEEMVKGLWKKSEEVLNRMQWDTKRNLALIVELAKLYEECIDRVEAVNFYTKYVRGNLEIKASAIRLLIQSSFSANSMMIPSGPRT